MGVDMQTNVRLCMWDLMRLWLVSRTALLVSLARVSPIVIVVVVEL